MLNSRPASWVLRNNNEKKYALDKKALFGNTIGDELLMRLSQAKTS